MLIREIARLDAVLAAHAVALGDDFTPYRNHAYRVANLCLALSPGGPQYLEKIAIAAAFHDLGIWTDGTFDYLEPSVSQARAYLVESDRTEWMPEITEMIRQHHKISAYRREAGGLVEAFRRADWVDVTRGLRRFGLPRQVIGDLYAVWPGAGFHRLLVRLELRHLRFHPLSPAPMVRL